MLSDQENAASSDDSTEYDFEEWDVRETPPRWTRHITARRVEILDNS
jgi:hypothetical protein